METFPLLVPLLILIPSIGTFINFFWGAKMGERAAGYLASGASILTFIISFLIFTYLRDSHAPGVVVEPFFFDGWIRIDALDFAVDIPWEFRVDGLTSTMLLVITGVGSLIHLYSIGYIHGDEKAPRFFAFLNMFLAFMLLLVTGNNLLVMFVGWEGVGVCSFLLIGYWWDKKGETGWQNSNAARKAMILNRVGDFGILMAIFLTFWTFGTIDYYKPGESSNVCYHLEYNERYGGLEATEEEFEDAYSANGCDAHHGSHGDDHSDDSHSEDDDHSDGESVAEDSDTPVGVPADSALVGTDEDAEDDHSEEDADHSDTEDDHSEEDADHSEGDAEEDDHSEDDDHSVAGAADDHGDDHGSDDGYGDGHHGATFTVAELSNSNFMPAQLGMFNQAEVLMALGENEMIPWSYDPLTDTTTMRGRDVHWGPFTVDIGFAIGAIVLFLLLGASGKSAQIPLFVWLPDAMAGPTPVSALMHAATMVTAGVYLLVRSSVFLDLVPEARFVVAIIGALTAVMAGLAAVGQWDVKRVLAYSTISQLGFMVAAVGIGAYVAAMFHLVTHAVFKALLFLGSGSLIHGVEHGEHHLHEHDHGHDDDHHDDEHHDDEHAFDAQDMRNMGGLADKMPITFATYLVGTFGLMGLPFFAGFWSKDEILLEAFLKAFSADASVIEATGALIVFGLLTVAAFFTTFYMWRQIQMVFFGKTRSEAAAHAPESTPWMTIPLVILALLVFWVGFINVPEGTIIFDWLFNEYHKFGHFLEGSIPSITEHEVPKFNWLMAIATSIALPGAAIFLAHNIYAGDKAVEDRDEAHGELGVDPLYKNPATRQVWVAANRRLYSDDLYHALFLRPYERIGKFLAETLDWDFWHDYFHNNVIKRGYDAVSEILSKPIDVGVIDAVVNGVGKLISFFSGRSRGIQTGYVRTYAVAVFLGVVVVIVLMLLPLLVNGS
ncbi:MAG: proton-conducting transporter membrane subunit [Chloroflexota bacterium]